MRRSRYAVIGAGAARPRAVAGLAAWLLFLPVAAAETVHVDFSVDRGPVTYAGSGFLNGLFDGTQDPDLSLVVGVHPQFFRDAYSIAYDQADKYFNTFGIQQLQVPLSTVWPGLGENPPTWPGDGGDWTRWDAVITARVTELVTRYQTNGWPLSRIAWECWNEPDGLDFWNPTGGNVAANVDRFFEMYRRTYVLIKSIDPNAVMSGPGNAIWGPGSVFEVRQFTVHQFLDFARDQGVLPDVLTWHEWRPADILRNVPLTRAYLADPSNGFGDYDPPISLNEIGHYQHQTEPGVLAHYFGAIERAGVVTAARSCWPDQYPDWGDWRTWNCYHRTLNGLLTPCQTSAPNCVKQPRATWWMYRLYAEQTGRLVDVVPSATVDGVAALDASAHTAQVLLGKFQSDAQPVTLELTGLDAAAGCVSAGGWARVRIERVPAVEWSVVQAPILRSETLRRAVGGALTLTIDQFGAKDGYAVWLRNPASLPFDPGAADFDHDGDADLSDFTIVTVCFNGPQRPPALATGCEGPDFDFDGDVDLVDFSQFLQCFNGPSRPIACH